MPMKFWPPLQFVLRRAGQFWRRREIASLPFSSFLQF